MPSSTPSSPRDIILHRRSQVFAKRPRDIDIQLGEIAINYDKDDTSLYLKDNENKIRKVGGIFYSDTAPDPTLSVEGYQDLSHGELWVERVDPPNPGSTQSEDALLHVWNKYINSGSGGWVEIGEFKYALIEKYLDQFKDATDGSDYIHTDRNQLKINNKSALRGYATSIPSDNETDSTKANTLVINDGHNFATGVLLNANNFVIDSSDVDITADNIAINSDTSYSFQTDAVAGSSESVFTYNDHGLFNGEEIFVEQYLNDGVTLGGVPQGNYVIAEASLNTFKLYNGTSNVLSTGNVRIKYSPKLILDQNFNITQSGNFIVKGLEDIPDTSQIEENRWDIYRNTLNGNVRVYSRANNKISEVGSSSVTTNIKNGSGGTIPALTPVYFMGFDPIKKMAIVGVAEASTSSKMNAIGITNAEILAGGYGVATVFGELSETDTSGIDGEFTGTDDSGRVLFVKNNGGLTFAPIQASDGIRQPIGILFKEDGTNGRIFVNHPDINKEALLQEGYIWAGVTGDNAVAHRLNTNNFNRYIADDGELEIRLSDEIKFGAYEFLWDEDSESKIQSNVSTTTQAENTFPTTFTVVDTFSTTYRSAKFFVQVSHEGFGFTSNYQITELLAIHDGTNVDIIDYGTASSPGERMGDFSAEVVGSNVEIYFSRYEAFPKEITIKVVRTAVLS